MEMEITLGDYERNRIMLRDTLCQTRINIPLAETWKNGKTVSWNDSQGYYYIERIE